MTAPSRASDGSLVPTWADSGDLAQRVETATRKAATPAYAVSVSPQEVDVEAFRHVGDPLAEALVRDLRDAGLMGDPFGGARQLQAAGVEAAVAFFADVEHVPAWADFDAMRAGAAMGRQNAVGLLLGVHGALPFTYTDPATAQVMQSTGRLTRWSKDFELRFWETASAFVGALDVDGMRPGGPRWEQWVRIRLLHTMIRMGILRSGRWDLRAGMPIDQTATAAGAHIFGRYRVNIIRSCGGRVSDEEAESFGLMWRWVSRIEGANSELLGSTVEDELRIQRRIHEQLYTPDDNSRAVTSTLIDGLAQMRGFPHSRRPHAAVVRRLLAENVVETLPGHDVPGDLGVPSDRPAEVLVAAALTGLRVTAPLTRLPAMRRWSERHGQDILDRTVDRALDHRKANYRATKVVGDDGAVRA